MKGYRYTVFGAGRQGTAAVHDLILNCEAQTVLVVEPDAARRREAAARLKKLLGQRAGRIQLQPAADRSDLKGTHAVLSCAPYAANPMLTKLALSAGVAFTDLGGNPEVVRAQQRLSARAKSAVVPDCGVSPGLTNILAVHCARVHGCDQVEVRCGGLPLDRPDPAHNPLQYKLVFSARGLLSEYSGAVPVIRSGRLGNVPALGVVEEFDADHESSPTSNNSPQVVEYLRECGVRDYNYMTVRYKGHWQLVQGWRALGWLCGDEMRDAELARLLEQDPVLHYEPQRDRDKLMLRVRGARRDSPLQRGFEYSLTAVADRRTRFSAMELTTSWGITIVAHHIASGRGAPRGFATPERFVDTEWTLGELERRLKSVRR